MFSVKPGFTTISPMHGVVASFDREGRLFSFIEDGRSTVARWRLRSLYAGAKTNVSEDS